MVVLCIPPKEFCEFRIIVCLKALDLKGECFDQMLRKQVGGKCRGFFKRLQASKGSGDKASMAEDSSHVA